MLLCGSYFLLSISESNAYTYQEDKVSWRTEMSVPVVYLNFNSDFGEKKKVRFALATTFPYRKGCR